MSSTRQRSGKGKEIYIYTTHSHIHLNCYMWGKNQNNYNLFPDINTTKTIENDKLIYIQSPN